MVQMVTIRICDENLSKLVPCHKTHNLFDPLGIQLIEDIIEQEEWGSLCVRALEKIKLREFQGDHKRLVLTLTALALHLMAAVHDLQVVTMDAVKLIDYGAILEAITLDDFQ